MADRRGGRIPLVRFAQRVRRKRKPVRVVEIDEGASIADRSSWIAFMLGGVTIAGGLLAMLYYDSVRQGPRDALATGSILSIERPARTSAPPRLAG